VVVPEHESTHLGPALVRELDAVRRRLDQAHEWLRNGETSLTAAVIAERTKHLCVQARQSEDAAKRQQFLAQANKCLHDLQKLLGLH
jgi:predicted solute-binding protein